MSDIAANPRRRFLRFSLRAMLLIVLVIGVSLGWTLHKVREQGKAVMALEEMGCEIEYLTDDGLVHLHALSTLKYLALRKTQVTDAGIHELKNALPTLTIYP